MAVPQGRDRPTLPPDDAGFTLVEVIVAFTLFLVFSTAVLSVLGAGIKVGGEDDVRLAAANLASRELEVTRDVFGSPTRGPNQVPIGTFVNPSPLTDAGAPGAGNPLVVDNVPFTVTRRTQWASVGSAGGSACDDTVGDLGYLRVSVEVTWPDLGSRPPVSMYTTMTPRKDTYAGNAGHIALRVIGLDGTPQANIPVMVAGPTTRGGTTDAEGCVVLAFLTKGAYQVTLNAAGYVGRQGDPTAAKFVQVVSAQVSRESIEYDRAARITGTFTTVAGYGLPINLDTIPVVVSNNEMTPTVRALTGTGNPRVLGNLYPYTAGYQVFAGSCPDNDPQYPDNKAQPSPVRVEVESGQTKGGAKTDTSQPGYSGSGFVNGLSSNNARVENIVVDRTSAGSTAVTIRYSTDVANRSLNLNVNGDNVGTFTFPNTSGSWASGTISIDLRADANQFTFAYTNGARGGVSLDYLETTPTEAPPTPVGARESAIGTNPGGSAAGTVRLAPIDVTGAAGLQVKARQDDCSEAPTLTLGPIPANGVLRTSLPYGTWQLWATSTGTRRTVLMQAPLAGGTVATPTVAVQ